MYGGYTQDCCYPVSAEPSYGYGGYGGGGGCFGGGFALIIVLFILLIIVGACFC
ncbi:YjcZ family sporulation protein [Peribacillus butanolivorans]|uniref:YjcZ family sporulation protein n=1 Tax=Peribacillus butanolivorans TaxID=421767 RepID=UPI00367B1130